MKKKTLLSVAMAVFLFTSSVFGAPMLGGWKTTSDIAINKEEKAIFDQAMKSFVGMDYEPLGLLATQLVSGQNYCFLCRGTIVYPEANPEYYFVYIYKDLKGNAEILEIKNIEFGLSPDMDNPDSSKAAEDMKGIEDIENAEDVENDGSKNIYSITISPDTESYMIFKCPESAAAGETVRVEIADVTDAWIYASVNGDQDFGTFVGSYYEFTMPEEDVEIKVWAVGNGLA
ncbi:MAG: hypothetical protein IKE58_00720 [Blautia sp.]|nr:hypothetical protein [Blautia sp.]